MNLRAWAMLAARWSLVPELTGLVGRYAGLIALVPWVQDQDGGLYMLEVRCLGVPVVGPFACQSWFVGHLSLYPGLSSGHVTVRLTDPFRATGTATPLDVLDFQLVEAASDRLPGLLPRGTALRLGGPNRPWRVFGGGTRTPEQASHGFGDCIEFGAALVPVASCTVQRSPVAGTCSILLRTLSRTPFGLQKAELAKRMNESPATLSDDGLLWVFPFGAPIEVTAPPR